MGVHRVQCHFSADAARISTPLARGEEVDHRPVVASRREIQPLDEAGERRRLSGLPDEPQADPEFVRRS